MRSIRTHLLFLVLAISIPLVCTIGLGIYLDRLQTIAHTKDSLKILVNAMASNTDNRINSTRSLLERLAERPLVKALDEKNCDPILRELYSLNPDYANVGYTDTKGLVICSALPQPEGKPINIGKSPWFQDFLAKRKFTIGEPFFGPISHKWVSVLVVPIWNARHEMTGAVELPLDLKSFDPNIPARTLPEGSHYGFFGEDGVMVWRNSDDEHVIGTHPQSDAAKKINSIKNGEMESLAADGVMRYYSMLQMPGTGWIAWVGVPVPAIYGAANKRAYTATAFGIAVLLVLFRITLFITARITKPVTELKQAARAVHSGNLEARATVRGPSDIVAVSDAFNAMVEAQQKSIEQLRIAATAFESQESIMVTDADRRILQINSAFTENTGYELDEIKGKTPIFLRTDRYEEDFYRAMWECVNSTGNWQGEMWQRHKNGEIHPKWLTITAVRNNKGEITHYVNAHLDITERKLAEEKIKELAFYDQLTGLPNRTLLLDHLMAAKNASARSYQYCALMLIDLDNFKMLNDTFGHDTGDLLLKQVASRLSACIRTEETVARLGGDEFVVVLANLGMHENEAANHTRIVGEKILSSLNQAYQLGDVACHSSPSIGITLFKGHLSSHEDLLKQADLAMYKAKESGRNAMLFFDPAMQTLIMERSNMETGLRNAISQNQLQLHYQAQVAENGRIIGAEALVRWNHPERGMVSPADFIPLAEETGLILPLGLWVMDEACTKLASWAKLPGLSELSIAVNISAHQFRQADFVEQVLSVLDKTRADPRNLKLELTESLMVQNIEDTIEKMFKLKARGIGFSLDDFGTGYSSLSYLKRMPLDQLKIDRSFVRDVLIDPNDAAIAKTIVALAQSLDLSVIAEGVETEKQREFLAHSGCHAYQGYLFSKPLIAADFEKFVGTRPDLH